MVTYGYEPDAYGRLMSKMQRALRNGTGCNFSNAEVRAFLHSEAWQALVQAEWDELKAENPLQREAPDAE